MNTVTFRRALLGACLLVQALTYNHALAADTAPITLHAAPSLAQFIVETVATHPTVKASNATRDAANARAQAAAQPLYNPALELNTERAGSNSHTLGLNLTLDMNGKRAARSAAAQYEFEVAKSERTFTRQTLTTQLLSELARHQTVQRIETLTQRQVELMQRFARLTEKSHAAGDVGQVEVDLAHLALSEAHMRHSETGNERLSSEEAMLGMGATPSVSWPTLPDGLPDSSQLGTKDTSLEKLAELQTQRAKVNAAQARMRMAEAERRPDPTLGVRGGRDGDDTLTGMTLSVPLFVRNGYRAEINAAAQDALREELTEQDLRRRADVRLSGALQRYRNAAQTWNVWQANGSASLANRTQQLERLWQAGELSATDYLVQVQQSIDAEIQSLRLWSSAWAAWSDWLTASGSIDDWLGISINPMAHDTE